MSLINNALKKAQHQRSGDTASVPIPGGAARRTKRGRNAMPMVTLGLMIVGAVALITASVVATIILIDTDKANADSSITVADAPPQTMSSASQTPAAPSPKPKELTITAPVEVEPEPVVKAETPVSESLAALAQLDPTSVEIAPEPVEAPPQPVIPIEERIYQFIDEIQVMGIRSSGADSKVLMNNQVYRVNDLVNRTLQLRLIAVTPDSLTFEDGGGASYTKKF